MALLGFQVVLTMIGASCLQKLGPLNSFAKWMLGSTGLVRFLPPTDTELRRHVKLPKELLKREKKKEKNGTVAVDTFSVPRSIDVQLDAVKVVPMELLQLKFYSEYQWLLDFSICTLIIYGISEVYYYLVPASTEANLSVVWVALVIGFCVKILFSLTKLYFIGGEDSSGERSLCFLAGFFFLLVGMVVLVVDESLLELSLEPALEAFKDNAGHFLKQQGVQSSGPASKLILKLCLALCGGVLGAMLVFPGFRTARMHWTALEYAKESPLTSVLLTLSFISPLALVILWIRPLSRDYLTVTVWPGMTGPLLSSGQFESGRFYVLFLILFLRLVTMSRYLQAYLNLAYQQRENQKREAGNISNHELKRSVARVFYYLCVVALQYLVPALLVVFQGLLLKSMGGYNWIPTSESGQCPAVDVVSTLRGESELPSEMIKEMELNAAQQVQLSLSHLRMVFSEEVIRGVLTFTTWWTAFAWFSSSAVGILYCSYFSQT